MNFRRLLRVVFTSGYEKRFFLWKFKWNSCFDRKFMQQGVPSQLFHFLRFKHFALSHQQTENQKDLFHPNLRSKLISALGSKSAQGDWTVLALIKTALIEAAPFLGAKTDLSDLLFTNGISGSNNSAACSSCLVS